MAPIEDRGMKRWWRSARRSRADAAIPAAAADGHLEIN
jgi:hypothetical protein